MTVLQWDLCKGATAECPRGGADIGAAIATVRQRQPSVVTLNEVCAGDITRFAFETGYEPRFAPVGTKASTSPYRCPAGRGDFGIAILSHPGQGAPGQAVQKRFSVQDDGNKQRVLLCVPYSKGAACTAFLSDVDSRVASAQCRELTDVATRLDMPAVIGAGLNLTPRAASACVPGGWIAKGDGGGQYVLAPNTFRLRFADDIAIPGTSHPGLLVGLSS